MKIVHLSPSFLPHLGGVETHVYQLSKELISAGHQITVLTLSESTASAIDDVDQISVVRYQAGLPVQSSWSYKIGVWRWLWRERQRWMAADVINVHDVFWWIFPFLPWVSHKVFTTFHGWETVYPVRLTAKIQRAVWSWLSVATIHVGAWIQEFYWDKPTAVIYGAPNNPPKKLDAKTGLQLKKVVFIGRLSSENEVEKYITFFTKLRQSFPKIVIQWVGDGPLRTACEKYGEVTGMVKNPDTYLESADLVAVNSYLAMWMGLAAGKICVSFYSHPLKKRYLETFPGAAGMLIGEEPLEMVKKIKSLEQHPEEIKNLKQKSAAVVREQSWGKIADVYVQLWRGH